MIYLATREPTTFVVMVMMPTNHEEKPDPKLEALIRDHRLCAFVYTPMINPLTHLTVGPDREQLRVILRIARWQGNEADFWAAELFSDIGVGDVLADLQTWDEGKINPRQGL